MKLSKKKMKKALNLLGIFFILFIIFFTFIVKNYYSTVNYSKENYSKEEYLELEVVEKKISVNIKMGTPVSRVADILKEKGVINNKSYFFIYMKFNNLEGKIQAGDFIFNTPIGLKDVFKQLGNSKKKEERIIVPEGFTIDDIDNLLFKKGLIKKGEIINCAKKCKFSNFNFFYDGNIEGYLFPDTYFVPIKNFTPKSFLKRMLRNFKNKVLTEKFKNAYKRQGKKLSDIIIMASIIEREETNNNNIKMVSGILWKRIREGIPMGADATTRYFKKSKQGGLYTSDFKANNRYNTRRFRGLTPTAISNPGMSAIKASLNPKKSKYYFYLHDKKGIIHYGRTNNEHNLNKNRYLR